MRILYFTLLFFILPKFSLLCETKNLILNKYNINFIFDFKNIFKNRKKKSFRQFSSSILNYNIYLPNNMKFSNIDLNNYSMKINNFPLKDYNIISIDYGYTFMGLCILCKNKFIYEKIISRHKNFIYDKNFNLPIKDNIILFYAVNFQNYIFNFFYFFQFLFEFIFNYNILVIVGCNGSYMNKLASDMGRHICYFMNKIEKKKKDDNQVFFDVNNEVITLKNDNIYKKEDYYIENFNFCSDEKINIGEKNILNFLLKNMVTKVKDENNTLFSKFYNKNCKNRKDSLSACYLLYYYLKYYDINNNFFLIPSKNVNYIYHLKK
ncbi:conserved Plasmodium protein, unknown function [Plasmodium gallinaceum]|uniref:Uncharacterized protein n=1 Tax=Plasmodium gallinaceum TaxID=5849 RepID=A0A1J1GMX3_PLAGA|nr:conserved Plasmodium protein, unknown function [Plasmodium gallinaceum]CRG93769.1 conserved Plasmodium protein, unknown function [Plasmodium gallinaceum]